MNDVHREIIYNNNNNNKKKKQYSIKNRNCPILFHGAF